MDVFECHVEMFMGEPLPDEIKRKTLASWKDTLIELNSNRLLVKVEAERHFRWLACLEGHISTLEKQ